MSKYKITTETGTYIIETEDPPAPDRGTVTVDEAKKAFAANPNPFGVADTRSTGQVVKDSILNNLYGVGQFFVEGIPGMVKEGAAMFSDTMNPTGGGAQRNLQRFQAAGTGVKDTVGPLLNDADLLNKSLHMDITNKLLGRPPVGSVQGTPSTPEQQRGYQNFAGQNLAGTILPEMVKFPKVAAQTFIPESLPARMYESALKPGPRSNTLPEIRRMVATGLREGIPVSERGAAKADAIVDALNSEIKQKIDAAHNQGVTVNKYSVASRLSPTAKRLAEQVNPEADLNIVSKSGNEFLRNQPAEIPAKSAQAIKQGTYRALKDKAYGEVKGASIESQKALARGLKEELAAKIPEINKLNLAESEILQLKPELEAAVNRIRNKEMMGIGTPIMGGAVGAVTGSAKAGILAGIVRALIDRPAFKSRLAIALERARTP